jgi:hypothetical protein
MDDRTTTVPAIEHLPPPARPAGRRIRAFEASLESNFPTPR